MHIVVPVLLDTGRLLKREEDDCDVKMDVSQAVEKYSFDNDLKQLRWQERTSKSGYLYIVRAWKRPFFDTRMIRVQCHKVRPDGSLGPRIIIIERKNGRVIR